jgi:hypothetical protein
MATLAVAAADGTFRATNAKTAVNLCTAQTGTGDSTNVADRGGLTGGGAIVITNVAGGTPSVVVNIQGSADGVAWFNVPYALVATPRTFVVTALTITTAVTTTYLLQEGIFWRYLKLALSANTNQTLTADFYPSGS